MTTPTVAARRELPDIATRSQVAEYLQISTATLARWASEGDKGPRFIKLGGSARYRREDVLAYIAASAGSSA